MRRVYMFPNPAINNHANLLKINGFGSYLFK
jgi:hypothetical protein